MIADYLIGLHRCPVGPERVLGFVKPKAWA
jgi:hypothetical protein